MSRFDAELFCEPPDPEFLCSVCKSVLDDPKQTPCRHVFCKVCITRWLANKYRCPVCRRRCKAEEIQSILPMVQNLLNKLTMRCKNFRADSQEESCQKITPMEYYHNHLKKCGYETVSCPFKQCGEKILRKDYSQHKSICDYRPVFCTQGCELKYIWKERSSHSCVKSLKALVNELREKNKDLKAKLNRRKKKNKSSHSGSRGFGTPPADSDYCNINYGYDSDSGNDWLEGYEENYDQYYPEEYVDEPEENAGSSRGEHPSSGSGPSTSAAARPETSAGSSGQSSQPSHSVSRTQRDSGTQTQPVEEPQPGYSQSLVASGGGMKRGRDRQQEHDGACSEKRLRTGAAVTLMVGRGNDEGERQGGTEGEGDSGIVTLDQAEAGSSEALSRSVDQERDNGGGGEIGSDHNEDGALEHGEEEGELSNQAEEEEVPVEPGNADLDVEEAELSHQEEEDSEQLQEAYQDVEAEQAQGEDDQHHIGTDPEEDSIDQYVEEENVGQRNEEEEEENAWGDYEFNDHVDQASGEEEYPEDDGWRYASLYHVEEEERDERNEQEEEEEEDGLAEQEEDGQNDQGEVEEDEQTDQEEAENGEHTDLEEEEDGHTEQEDYEDDESDHDDLEDSVGGAETENTRRSRRLQGLEAGPALIREVEVPASAAQLLGYCGDGEDEDSEDDPPWNPEDDINE